MRPDNIRHSLLILWRNIPFETKVTGAYILLAGLWIYISDHILLSNVHSQEQIFSILKGWGYVGVSAILLFLLTRRTLRSMRQIKQSLTDSDTKFRSIAQNIPGMVFQMRVRADGSSYMSYISPRASELFNLSLDPSHPDWHLGARIHPDDQLGFLHSIQQAVEHFIPWQYEGRIIQPDRSVKWFRGFSSPTHSGDEIVFDGLLLDISGEKEADNYRNLVNKTHDGYFTTDKNGIITFANPKLAELHGFQSPNELIGKPFADYIAPYAKEQTLQYFRRFLEKSSIENDFIAEIPVLRKNGAIFFVELKASIIIENGESIGTRGVIRDITGRKYEQETTERKKAEEALFESERRYRIAAQAADLGFWSCDLQTGATEWDEITARIFGYAPGEAQPTLEHYLQEIVHPDYRQFLQSQFQQDNVEQFSGEYPILHKDGQVRWIKDYGVFLRSADGQPQRVVGVKYDITQRKQTEQDMEHARQAALSLAQDANLQRVRAEEVLRELARSEHDLIQARDAAELASRAKSAFLANMSHEIRTPMNAVIGLTHLALQTPLTLQQRDYLIKIQASAQNLLGIINDILDFSKIEAGKMSIASTPFDLNEVLENLATMVNIWAREKDLEVIFAIAPDTPTALIGDPLRLEQVLINLGNNAIKFTEHGEVIFSTRLLEITDDLVEIEFSVRDTGVGMTPKQLERLFQAFNQGDTSTTRKYGGTGLGLTISKHLVELMGGDIIVHSQPGVGSEFIFTARFGHAAPAQPLPFTLAGELQNLRVLVVEDNPTAQQTLKNYLQPFLVTLTDSGEEALQILELTLPSHAYDIIILDWKLPGINGLEVARRVRNQSQSAKSPIILMVTAHGRETILSQAEALHLDGLLVKPISQSALINAILHALSQDRNDQAQPSAEFIIENVPGIAALHGKHILLVEDNEINLEVAQGLLALPNIQVSIARNGVQAVEMVQLADFDAVLMDIQMPEMDGYEATRRIRRIPGHQTLPIIAMTAHAMSGDREKSLENGMNDHINKPIEPDEMFNTLLHWIAPDVYQEQQEHPLAPRHTPQKTTFPTLPGIDTAAGLRHLGTPQNYSRVLQHFRQQQPEVSEIRSALNRSDISTAHRLVHSLKGVAGTIGASELEQAASNLENALDHHPLPDVEILLSALDEHLAKVIQAIDLLPIE